MENIRQYIQEVAPFDLNLDRISHRYEKELPISSSVIVPGSIFFDSRDGVLKAEIYTAKNYGAWDDRPKYDPHTYDYRGNKQRPTDSYEIMLWWENWPYYLEDLKDLIDTGEESIGKRKIGISQVYYDLFNTLDVKVHCNDPSWHWHGLKAVTKDSAQGSADDNSYPLSPNYSARHINWVTVDRPLCKHLRTFINLAKNNSSVKEDIKWAIYDKISDVLEEV